MAPFIKAYVKNFASEPLTSDDFRIFFCEYFSGVNLDAVDWDAWFLEPGMPPVENKFDKTLYEAIFDLKKKWLNGEQKGTTIQGWKTTQINVFLDSLQNTSVCNADTLREMDKMYVVFENVTLSHAISRISQLYHSSPTPLRITGTVSQVVTIRRFDFDGKSCV